MERLEHFKRFTEAHPYFFLIMAVLCIWEAVWKLIALWHSARNNHLAWFICIAVFNTAGILSIVYIVMQKRKPHKVA